MMDYTTQFKGEIVPMSPPQVGFPQSNRHETRPMITPAGGFLSWGINFSRLDSELIFADLSCVFVA